MFLRGLHPSLEIIIIIIIMKVEIIVEECIGDIHLIHCFYMLETGLDS